MIEGFKNEHQKKARHDVLKNAIIKNGIPNVSMNNDSVVRMQYAFSDEIKTGKVTSQEKSGRCWLFAGLNIFRQKIAQEFKIKDFELSQSYPLFWDKLEKANYFLENILDTAEEGIYSRIVMWLLEGPVQDGGQWDMFSNLVKKYGVVPKSAMPETHHSSNTRIMEQLLSLKLREDAATLRAMHTKGADMRSLRERKDEMMDEIYSMLAYFLGEPPQTFDFEYRDEDESFHQDIGLTPHDFFQRYVKVDLNDLVCVIHSPTQDKPFNRTFTVQYLGNVKDGKSILYLNVDGETIKQLALSQLKDRSPVMFGCDVSHMMDRDTGIMDTDLYLYEEALGVSFNMDKARRLDYGESKLNHAMVFTGVNLVEGKPNRWKVENSWGEKAGKDGFFIMSDSWFDEFNYQIVVHKKYLSEELVEALKQKPIVLPPWDPFGALALTR